jgi:hypothetical protein
MSCVDLIRIAIPTASAAPAKFSRETAVEPLDAGAPMRGPATDAAASSAAGASAKASKRDANKRFRLSRIASSPQVIVEKLCNSCGKNHSAAQRRRRVEHIDDRRTRFPHAKVERFQGVRTAGLTAD